MDKLEQYLDQVCRGIAGPRSLRQHIRQELREHLADAVAGHVAAGMSEDEAIERSLENFGGPELVRSELEATHGHRLMTLVIDRAMQWKESTMKAKWLWTTWAQLALAIVIALQLAFVFGVLILMGPKFKEFVQLGWIDAQSPEANPAEIWAHSYLSGLHLWMLNWPMWVIPAILLCGLFEWRVRSENKSFVRLSIMGTLAVGLMVVVALTAAAVSLPFFIEMPVMNARQPEGIVTEQLARIDSSMNIVEQALAKEDWGIIGNSLWDVTRQMDTLGRTGSAAPALLAMREENATADLRQQLKQARDSIREAAGNTGGRNIAGVQAAMKKFREAYGKVRNATTKSAN